MCSVVCGDGAGVALRAESRITPPKIQGGAAEVKTPASFPTLSHNFGKPRSARRGRDWNGRGKPRPFRFHRSQNLCDYSLCERRFQSKSRTEESTLRPLRSLREIHPPRPLRSLREIHPPRPLRARLPQPRFARQPPLGGGRLRRDGATAPGSCCVAGSPRIAASFPVPKPRERRRCSRRPGCRRERP